QWFLRINEAGDFSTVVFRTIDDALDIWLIVLANISGVSAGDRTVFAHPCDGNRRIETARKGDTDAFANGERRQNLRHGSKNSGLTTASPNRCAERPGILS